MKLLDPRGAPRPAQPVLAARAGAQALAQGTVVFYDNTKMDLGHYGLVFPRIQAGLREQGIARFAGFRETVRGKGEHEIEALAATLAAGRPAAAIIALADMGVSPAMVALCIALERRGIPTACITAGPGAALARAQAFYRATALCVCELDLFPGSTAQDVAREADAAVAAIVTMLSANGAALHAVAALEHRIDREAVAADGMLEVDATGGDALDQVLERFEALQVGDGLPIVPPTPARYEAMRRGCALDPLAVLFAGIGPSGAPVRVKDALVACVMAGCKPAFVPIVLAALRAMARPEYNLSQAITTSFGGGHFILASGPIAAQAGMHGGQGCLGPGFRANASIGRAVALVLTNVCRSVAGVSDLACLSSPAEYSYCMAENPPPYGWPAIHEERFGAAETCVMALMAESPHSVMDLASTAAAGLMETIVDCCTTLGSNNAYLPGALVLLLNPDHARLLHEGGFDKQGIRESIHEGARVERSRLRGRGLVAAGSASASGDHHVTRSPDDVQVVVCGGKGGHSAVIRPWALHSDAVFERVRAS